MKKISNPLTIIGLFAGIAEVAGTVVLPFVSESLQSTFLWYVMGFPALLIILFFLTLNFNHTVLYAPGDFADQNNFIKLIKHFNKHPEQAEKAVEQTKKKYPEYVSEINKEIEDPYTQRYMLMYKFYLDHKDTISENAILNLLK